LRRQAIVAFSRKPPPEEIVAPKVLVDFISTGIPPAPLEDLHFADRHYFLANLSLSARSPPSPFTTLPPEEWAPSCAPFCLSVPSPSDDVSRLDPPPLNHAELYFSYYNLVRGQGAAISYNLSRD